MEGRRVQGAQAVHQAAHPVRVAHRKVRMLEQSPGTGKGLAGGTAQGFGRGGLQHEPLVQQQCITGGQGMKALQCGVGHQRL